MRQGISLEDNGMILHKAVLCIKPLLTSAWFPHDAMCHYLKPSILGFFLFISSDGTHIFDCLPILAKIMENAADST